MDCVVEGWVGWWWWGGFVHLILSAWSNRSLLVLLSCCCECCGHEVGECRSDRLHMEALTKTTRDGRRSPFSRLFSGLVCFFYSFALRRPCVDTFSSDRKHKTPRDGTLDLPPVVVILSSLYLSSSARLFFLPSPSSPFRGGIEFLTPPAGNETPLPQSCGASPPPS